MTRQLLAINEIDLKFESESYEIQLKLLDTASIKTIIVKTVGLYLHFENITGKGIIPPIDVYINLAKTSELESEKYAGSFALFGLEENSLNNLEFKINTFHQILEVTELVRKLVLESNWSSNELRVTLKLGGPLSIGAWFMIGRVSLSEFTI